MSNWSKRVEFETSSFKEELLSPSKVTVGLDLSVRIHCDETGLLEVYLVRQGSSLWEAKQGFKCSAVSLNSHGGHSLNFSHSHIKENTIDLNCKAFLHFLLISSVFKRHKSAN